MVQEYIQEIIPSSSVRFGFNFVASMVFLVIALIIAGVILWLVLRLKTFNKKVILFEIIGNDYEPSRKFRAREINVGLGERALYITKIHRYEPYPEVQTGRNTFWYRIDENGEWVNFTLPSPEAIEKANKEDEDYKLKSASKGMRLARTSLQKNVKERFIKPEFMAKYGVIIGATIFFIILGIMSWLVFDKLVELSGSVSSNNQATQKIQIEVLDKLNIMLGAMDNICSGGSGIRPAGTT